jgi:hypothetical protein
MRRPPLPTPDPKPALSPERFSALAAAYGGDLRRWPEPERAAAQAMAQASALARAQLDEESALDAVLDGARVAAPSMALRRRILDQAPKSRQASARSRLMRWLSGLGAIGILTCGAAAGAAVVAVSGPSHVDADGVAALYDQGNVFDGAGA